MASSRETFVVLFWVTLICATLAFGTMSLAFITPYWIQSWRRVHSPFSNTGMWTICVSGYIKPMDPKLEAYVGCWWIHTSVFHDIANAIMPPWFRVVQMFVVLSFLCNLIVFVLVILFRFDIPRQSIYGEKPHKALFADAILLFAAALMVFIDSLIFAMKTTEATWMPRPYLNYLSWSFGFNVLSGFFSAFAGICAFLMAMMVKEGLDDKEVANEEEERGVDNVGVTGTPPPPKVKAMPTEGQPMPMKLYGYDDKSRYDEYHDDLREVHPYSDRQPYPATHAYQRRPLESTTDTEV